MENKNPIQKKVRTGRKRFVFNLWTSPCLTGKKIYRSHMLQTKIFKIKWFHQKKIKSVATERLLKFSIKIKRERKKSQKPSWLPIVRRPEAASTHTHTHTHHICMRDKVSTYATDLTSLSLSHSYTLFLSFCLPLLFHSFLSLSPLSLFNQGTHNIRTRVTCFDRCTAQVGVFYRWW